MADTSGERILIDVQLNYQEALSGMAKVKQQVTDLRQQQKELDKAFKAGEITSADYAKQWASLDTQIAAANATLRSYQTEARNAAKAESEQDGSLNQLRAQLALCTKQYDAMSKAMRESAEGEELREQINALSEALSEAEQATGRFQRNVGNYPSAFKAAVPGFDTMEQTLTKMGVTLEDLSTKGIGAFANLGTSAKAFGRVLLTPPVALIAAALSAILLVFNKVSDAVKKNDEVSTSLQKSYAVLQPVITALNKVFQALATTLAKIVEVGASVLSTVLSLVPGYKEAAQAAQELVQAEDDLEDKEREYTKNHAAWQAEVSELRNKANQEEEYTAKQRQEFLQQALDLLRKDADAHISNLNEHVRILKERAEQEQDTSDSTKDAIAQAEAARDEAEREFNQQSRRIITQLNTLSKQTGGSMEEASKAVKDESTKIVQDLAAVQLALVSLGNTDINIDMSTAEADIKNFGKITEATINNLLQQLRQARAEINVTVFDAEQALNKAKSSGGDTKSAQADVDTATATQKQIEASEKALRDYQDMLTTLANANKSTSDSMAKDTEDYVKRAEEIHKELRDAVISTIQDEAERSKAELQAQYSDEIETLKSRLATEKKLTQQERDDLNALIKIKEQSLTDELTKIDEQVNAENTKRQEAAAMEALQLRVSAAKKGTQEEVEARVALLQAQYNQEISQTDLTEQEKLNIQEKYRQKAEALTVAAANVYSVAIKQEFAEIEAEARKVSLADGILPDNDASKVSARWRDFLKQKLDVLEETYGDMAESSKEYIDTLEAYEEASMDAQEKSLQKKAQSYQDIANTITSGLTDAFGEMFDDLNISFTEFMRSILTTTLNAIEAAILAYEAEILAKAIAQKLWAGVAEAAALTALVTASFELAKAAVASFATGGIVGGDSETGDRVIARVNSGEMILNKDQQAATYQALTGEKTTASTLRKSQQQELFMLLNGGGITTSQSAFATGGIVGGSTSVSWSELVADTGNATNIYNSGMSAKDLRDALEDMPAPVLEYREFNRFVKKRERNISYGKL